MTYEEIDEDTMVTEKETLCELRKHGVDGYFGENREIIDVETGETICTCYDGEYKALDVLNWLGY